MEIKEGMYVRVNGRKSSSVKYQNCFMIDKIRHIDNSKSKYRYLVRPDKDDYCLPISEEMIVNASFDIIDLIEPQDLMYVDIYPDDYGGIVVPMVAETMNELNAWKERLSSGEYILKGVVTHEQLSDIVFKVGGQI